MRELKNWTEYTINEVREEEIVLLGKPKDADDFLGYVWVKETDGALEAKEKRERHIQRAFARTEKLNTLQILGVEIPKDMAELRELLRDVGDISRFEDSLACAKVLVCEKRIRDERRELELEKAKALGMLFELPEKDALTLKKRLIKRMERRYLLNDAEMKKILRCLTFSEEGPFGTIRIREGACGRNMFFTPKPFAPDLEGLPKQEYYAFKMKTQEQIKRERQARLIKSARNGYIIQYRKPIVVTPKFWGTRVLSSADYSKIRTFLRDNPEVEAKHDPKFLERATVKSIDEYPYDPDGYYVYGALGELDSEKSCTAENILMGYCVLRRDLDTDDDWIISDFYIDPRFRGQDIEPMLIKNASRKAWGDVYVTIPYDAEGFNEIQEYFLRAGFRLKSQSRDSKTFIFKNKEERQEA